MFLDSKVIVFRDPPNTRTFLLGTADFSSAHVAVLFVLAWQRGVTGESKRNPSELNVLTHKMLKLLHIITHNNNSIITV